MTPLVELFEAQRPRLRSVAYRMLGSLSEADDAVQEAWLRLSRGRHGRRSRTWRLADDRVGARLPRHAALAPARREEPVDVHVPEPVVEPRSGPGPEHEALLADSVGLALLVVLDTLAPAERLAFVLHDLFAVPFDEIAPILGRSPAATRQLASRARRRVQGGARARPGSAGGARSSTRSSRPLVTATSTVSSPCSTRRSCSAPTAVRRGPARRSRSARRQSWPHRRPWLLRSRVRAAGARQRRGRRGRRREWHAVLDHGLHRARRAHRDHRRRSTTPSASRSSTSPPSGREETRARQSRPSSTARRTTSRRLLRPSFVRIADTWWSAVFGEM